MSPSSTIAVLAISCLALAGAGAAVFMSQQQPRTTTTTTIEQVDTTDLEQQIAQLRAEVTTLRARLDAVEAKPALSPTISASSTGTDVEYSAEAPEEDRIALAVEAVLEEKGVEYVKQAQRIAKRDGARDGMTKWVNSRRERLPALYERISQKMRLDPRRGRQVEDIIHTTFESMNELTEQLHAEPPLSDEDQYAIMGEIKTSVGTMVGQLDEVLEDEELIQLGELTIESELPRVGYAIIEEGKDDDTPAEDAEAGGN
ncbi:MAG: hypothetical protein AAF581_13520 [Planctomycetota bacterium]